MQKLKLSQDQYQKIINYCWQEKPLEACGILAGQIQEDVGEVKKIYLMENKESSSQEYFMEPEEQFEVFRDFREKDLELVSIFHSHPHTAAIPSDHDIQMAHYPEAIYLIISLENEGPSLRAYKIQNEDYQEIEVVINK